MTSRKQNKFADLISAAREVDELPAAEDSPAPAPARAAAPTAAPAHEAEPAARGQAEEAISPAEPPRRGRPPTGKRSNPAYEQVTAYIRRDTNLQTKIALLQEGNTRDFSDLVEELLQTWLRERQ